MLLSNAPPVKTETQAHLVDCTIGRSETQVTSQRGVPWVGSGFSGSWGFWCLGLGLGYYGFGFSRRSGVMMREYESCLQHDGAVVLSTAYRVLDSVR